MKSKHTPGPWSFKYTSAAQARKDAKAEGCNTDGGGADGFIFKPSSRRGAFDSVTVAFLPHHREVSEDAVRKCNAALLAAAPELLEALQECITEEGAHVFNNTAAFSRRLSAINEIARTAIARATGVIS